MSNGPRPLKKLWKASANDSGTWQTVSTKEVFTHPRLTLKEDRVKLATGIETDYLRIDPYSDYVTVIPVAEDGRLLLIEDYAYPIDQRLMQFPEGSCEDGETPVAAAVRELQEEAGLVAENVVIIGKSLHEHRRCTAFNHVVVAERLSAVEPLGRDAEEHGITTHWFDERELQEMIASGKIIQKNTLAAFAMLRSRQLPN